MHIIASNTLLIARILCAESTLLNKVEIEVALICENVNYERLGIILGICLLAFAVGSVSRFIVIAAGRRKAVFICPKAGEGAETFSLTFFILTRAHTHIHTDRYAYVGTLDAFFTHTCGICSSDSHSCTLRM